jgi:hypothetical protein
LVRSIVSRRMGDERRTRLSGCPPSGAKRSDVCRIALGLFSGTGFFESESKPDDCWRGRGGLRGLSLLDEVREDGDLLVKRPSMSSSIAEILLSSF